DFVDGSNRGLDDKTPVECRAVEVPVGAFGKSTPGIATLAVKRGRCSTDKRMEQRELPLRGDLENRAVTALRAPVAVVTAVKSRSVEVPVGRLEQRRVR